MLDPKDFYKAMMRMRPAQRPSAWVKNWQKETCKVLSEPYIPTKGVPVTLPTGRVLEVPSSRDRLIQGALQIGLSKLTRQPNTTPQGVTATLESITRKLESLSEAHVFRGDIKSFYASIPIQDLLPSIFAEYKITDPWIMSAVNSVFRAKKGVPQGSPLSSWVAEAVLGPLDVILSKNGGIRYADDILIIAKSKKELRAAKEEVDTYLTNRGLEFNEDKCLELVYPDEEFTFLGKVFQHRTKSPDILKVKGGSEGLGFEPYPGEAPTTISIQDTSDSRNQTPYGVILSKSHFLKLLADKPNLEVLMLLAAQEPIQISPQGEKILASKNQFLHRGMGKSLHDAAFKLYVGNVKPKQQSANPAHAAQVLRILIMANSLLKTGAFPKNFKNHEQEYQEAMKHFLDHDYEVYRKAVSKQFKENYALRQSNPLPEQSMYEQTLVNNEIDLLEM